LTGGGIFAILSLVTIIGVTQEQLDQMVEKAKSLAPFFRENAVSTMASAQFKTVMVIGVVIFVLASIIAGAVAGLIARKIFHHPSGSTHE
jgi:E3 ubiquitin-protein ligase DOA10